MLQPFSILGLIVVDEARESHFEGSGRGYESLGSD